MVDTHYRWDFVGLSTDTKPTPQTSEKVVDGSTFYCSDNSKLYVYCKDNWYERKALGGGGGTSYTAGTGINIGDDTISVDTTTIQEKLTAGTGIDITDNTISATGGGGSTNCRELTSADYNYDTNNDGVNDTVALWLLDPGVYWWDYSFANSGGIKYTTTNSNDISDSTLTVYSNMVIIGYLGNSSENFITVRAFARSVLVENSTYGYSAFIPYVLNKTTGAVVNFNKDFIPVGRGDLTT